MQYTAVNALLDAAPALVSNESIIVHKVIFSNSFFPGDTILYERDGTTIIASIRLKAGYPASTFDFGTPFVASRGLYVDPGQNQVTVFYSSGGA